MMSLGDVIAIYGAALASALAIIQYRQWLKSEEGLLVTPSREFCDPSTHLSATITNTQQSIVYLDFVGVGYRYRPWKTPWTRRHLDILSMLAIEGDYLTKRGVERSLAPGEIIDVYFDERDGGVLERPNRRAGFSWCLCIWVDPSRSDRSLCKPVTAFR
jgi:hypothetical protein